MAPSTRSTPASGALPVASALAVLADVAARLASASAPSDVLDGVLEVAQQALGAEECALWLFAPGGLVRTSGSGSEKIDTAEVASLLARNTGTSGPLTVARLVAGAQRLGAIAVRRDRPLAPDERVVLVTLGNMLAPILAQAEHSHQLEVEVEARTREIHEQRRFIERVVDSLPLGLYVVDREYRVQAWNRKRETGMQGVSRDDAMGRAIFDILHRQPAHVLQGELDEVFATGRIQQFEMESTVTGDRRTYRISKIPMSLDDSTITHVITIGEDVTSWREAQERFTQAEKLAAVGQLAAGVMHEINNPLATIAACAESLAFRFADEGDGAGSGPPGTGDYLKLIDLEVHRCKRIVDGLLDFSRPTPSDKTPTDVNAVLDQTLFLLGHHPRFKALTVDAQLDRSLGAVVRANAEQLVQVFMALLLNAVDAMAEQGTIVVRTRRGPDADAAVIAEVIDRGSGIARAEVGKIFEPFYTTKAPGRGTGMGLSICYGIIAEHGGRIEVESAVGQGSTFRVVLPAGGA